MQNPFQTVISYIKSSLSGPISTEEQERIDKAHTLKMIKHHRLDYMIVDRRDGSYLQNHKLAQYNESKHELLVDGHQFMKHIMRA